LLGLLALFFEVCLLLLCFGKLGVAVTFFGVCASTVAAAAGCGVTSEEVEGRFVACDGDSLCDLTKYEKIARPTMMKIILVRRVIRPILCK
jgi:hypothetical protein